MCSYFPSETLRGEGLLENTTLHKAKWKAGTNRQHPSPRQENMQVTAGASSYHVSHPPAPETLENRKPRSLGRKAGNHSPWADPQLVYIVLSTRKHSEEATKMHKQACKGCSLWPDQHKFSQAHLCWASGKDPIISSCRGAVHLQLSTENQQ